MQRQIIALALRVSRLTSLRIFSSSIALLVFQLSLGKSPTENIRGARIFSSRNNPISLPQFSRTRFAIHALISLFELPLLSFASSMRDRRKCPDNPNRSSHRLETANALEEFDVRSREPGMAGRR